LDQRPDPPFVTHAVVLSALRQIRLRQVTRARHTPLLDELHARGLIVWVRQPMRASHQLLPAAARAWLVPDEIAGLTDEGHKAYDTLTQLRASPEWRALAGQPWIPETDRDDPTA
jgi:hypothetical protein